MTLSDLPAPLTWLTMTILVFAAADAISRLTNRHPLAHPVLTSTPVVILLLVVLHTPYETYKTATFPLSFLLGPTTVCLAVPIWKYRQVIRDNLQPLALALSAGSLTAIVSAVGVAWAFGASPQVLASLAPRATTTPVAMAIADQLHGLGSLAAVAVLLSGVLGAVIYPFLFDRLGVRDAHAIGLAVGVSAHGIGTARAFQNDEKEGTFAAVGMGANAIFTAVVLGIASLTL